MVPMLRFVDVLQRYDVTMCSFLAHFLLVSYITDYGRDGTSTPFQVNLEVGNRVFL